MFENIENIDWENLEIADGSATKVPSAINGLISNDIDTQHSSYWKLDNHVVRQSDLYEAAYYIIPYLIEIVRCRCKNGRKFVYDLLYEISNGEAVNEKCVVFKGEKVPLAIGCRNAVADGMDLYLRELRDEESEAQTKALELILSFDEHFGKTVPELQKICDSKPFDDLSTLIKKSL